MLAPNFNEKNRYEMVFKNNKKYLPKEGHSWLYSKEKMLEMEEDGRISFEPNMPRKKTFLNETGLQPTKSLLLQDIAGNNQQGTSELMEIFHNKTTFSFPKPKKLLKYLISKHLNKNSTILDFFAGSGTTGHAVLELNKEDGGNRQFILCSNRENTKDNPDKNICRDITYERNKRVIQGYTNAKGEKVEGLGGNLRYYKTEFIPKNKSIDDLRDSFINKCDDLLCIKENTFTKVNLGEEIPELKIFKNKNNFTVILYDIFYFEKLVDALKIMEDKKVSLYIFSQSKNIFEEELEDFSNITFANIPNEILETYKKIFGL
ncbi:hypothetical protein HG442_001390 [Candidatus Gracilibacteria bacterium]|nr:hypothetical protein [Candidatus Gracilibacteria bacterium]